MRMSVRLMAVLCTAAALAACATTHFTPPVPPTDPSQMHAFHNNRTEWVYYSGVVNTAEGKNLGVMFTIFQATDTLTGRFYYPSILVVLDPETKHYYPQVDYGGSKAKVTLGVPRVDTSAARYALNADGTMSIQGKLSRNKTPLGVDLVMTPTRGPLLHGGNGIISMGDGIDSGYYSFTDMVPKGSVTIADARFSVVGGRIWMDHQWGNWTDGGMNWDWFSLRFDDGAALMLFQFRDKKNNVVPGNWSYRAADGTLAYGRDYELDALDLYHDKTAGATYPLDWRIRIKDLNASFSVSPLFNDQIVRPSRLWEGLCTFAGSIDGKDARGDAFVELAGY